LSKLASKATEHRQAGSGVFAGFVGAGDETVRPVGDEREVGGFKQFGDGVFGEMPVEDDASRARI